MPYKTLQIELWTDCNENCAFCYTRKNRVQPSNERKLNNLEKALHILDTADYSIYECVAIIGGEFFQGQLNDIRVYNKFIELIKKMNELVITKKVEQIWIASSLLHPKKELFESVLDLLEFDKYDNSKYRVLLCVSYDPKYRFQNKEHEDKWFDYLYYIHKKYPLIAIHFQGVISQFTIDKVINDEYPFDKIKDLGCINYNIPFCSISDFRSIEELTVDNYYEKRKEVLKEFPPDFFITDYNSYFKFLKKYAEAFDLQHIKDLSMNELRSSKLYYLDSELETLDRWDKNNEAENSPCGHPFFSYGFLNKKGCLQCEALKFYKLMKGELII